MKKILTISAQVLTVLIGLGAFAFMFYEPHLEGRNVGASNFDIYFRDPFLAYFYASSIFFFVALYHIFLFLKYIRDRKTSSEQSRKSLHIIRICSATFAALVAAAVVYLMTHREGSDDIAGGVAVGLCITLISAAVAVVARVVEKRAGKAKNNCF